MSRFTHQATSACKIARVEIQIQNNITENLT